ncbi:MAG: hypothetical protein NVSMB59_06190 [Vulcanimicrobiaceae bacterium]
MSDVDADREAEIVASVRVRMSAHDAHYGGDLVDGACVLALFGDLATELCIRESGDEGLFASYTAVEFLAPVRAGDFLEATARIVRRGTRSREMTFEARKVIAARPDRSPSAADVLAAPVPVARARGTCVVVAARDLTQRPAEASPPHVASAEVPHA